jgi:hypothetical protein
LLRVAGKRKGSLRDWLGALLARKPARLVTVALANKRWRDARAAWRLPVHAAGLCGQPPRRPVEHHGNGQNAPRLASAVRAAATARQFGNPQESGFRRLV